MDIEIYGFLFLAALVAGFVDAIAGGSGFITTPALLLSGLPPLQVLATGKCQSMFGTIIATYVMYSKKLLNIRVMIQPIIFVAVGALLGTVVVQQINREVLEFLIPCVLVIMLVYVLFFANMSDVQTIPRIKDAAYRYVAAIIGFYDGFIGPGTGSMFALSQVGLCGLSMREATARAKLYNLVSNMASFIMFSVGGYIYWQAAAVMIVGQMIGGYAGAHMVILKGTKIIKPMIAVTCIGMLIKYFLS